MPQMNFCCPCASPLIPGTASGRERLICSRPCGYIFYNNPLPVVGGIVEYGIYTFYQRNEVIFTYHVQASGTIVRDETELQAIKLVLIA